MKIKMKKTVHRKNIALIMTILLLLASLPLLPASADTPDDGELTAECTALLEEANIFAHLTSYNDPYVDYPTQHMDYYRFYKKGFTVYLESEYPKQRPADAYSTVDKWQELAKGYFTKGIPNLESHFETVDGVFRFISNENSPHASPIYDGMRILEKSENAVTFVFPAFIEYEIEDGHTAEFTKTESGWRISGGSYFNRVYGDGSKYTAPEQDSEFAEILRTSMEAFEFSRTLLQGYPGVVFDYQNGKTSLFIKKGYVDEHCTESIVLPLHSDPECDHFMTYYPYATEFDSFDRWKEEVMEYFTTDFLGLIPSENTDSPLREQDGKTYGASYADFIYTEADWCKAHLLYHDGNTAVIGVLTSDFLEDTIRLEKTEKGWRVSGGSFWSDDHGQKSPDEQLLKELADIGKDAEDFTRILSGFCFESTKELQGEEIPYGEAAKRNVSFLQEKGYVDEHFGEHKFLRWPTNPEAVGYYRLFHQSFTTKEEVIAEYLKYLHSDFLGLGSRYPYLIEHEGKVYFYESPVCLNLEVALWEHACLIAYTDTQAVVAVPVYEGIEEIDFRNFYGYATVEFVKTEDGWRVDGGSFYDFVYNYQNTLTKKLPKIASLPETDPEPPKTGEDTLVYLLPLCLSLAGFGGVTVALCKKRRRFSEE